MKLKTVLLAIGLLAGPAWAEIRTIVTFPGGSNSAVQFNKNGTFSGDQEYFSYSTSTKVLSVRQIQASTVTLNGVTYTWPTSQIGGRYLRVDGSGGLSWETPTNFSISSGVALGVMDGGVYISTPATSDINFSGTQFIVSLVGNTTAFVGLDPSSVTLLGALVANNPLTLSGSTFGVNAASMTLRGPDPSLGGDLTGTISNAAVTDDSHNHTTTSISGLDISADTNLTISDPITLTNDTVGIDKSSATLLGPSIDSSELPANGYDGTYVKVAGDAMTGQLTVRGSSITATGANGIRATYLISGGSLAARNLSNTLVAVDSNGVLISTTVTSGSGGASTLAISTSNVIVSSPTPQLNFNGSQVTASVSGGTTTITLSPSSVTLFGANVVRLNAPSQQTGALWVTSGTVSGAMVVGTMTVNGVASIGDALTVAGGITPSDLTANQFVITNGSKKLISMPLTPLPEGSSNYVQVDRPSQQSGAFNITSGTLNGPFTINITTAPPGTNRTMKMNSYFSVETSTSFPGDIASTLWNVIIPTASFQSTFVINAATATGTVNRQVALTMNPQSSQASLSVGQSGVTLGASDAVLNYGSSNKFIADVNGTYALVIDSFMVLGPGASGSSLGLRGGNNGSTWFSLYASTNMTQNTRYTVPNTYPSGTQALCSDANGNMSFGCVTGGGGGASTLETLFGTARSSPTATLRGAVGQFLGSVTSSTMTITLDPSSVTLQGNNPFAASMLTNAILNQSSHQSNAVFNISSGTVLTQLNLGEYGSSNRDSNTPLTLVTRHDPTTSAAAQGIYSEYNRFMGGGNAAAGINMSAIRGIFVSTSAGANILADGTGVHGQAIDAFDDLDGVLEGVQSYVQGRGTALHYMGSYNRAKWASARVAGTTSTITGGYFEASVSSSDFTTARTTGTKRTIWLGQGVGGGAPGQSHSLYNEELDPTYFRGYVGIGTKLPAYSLDVQDPSGQRILYGLSFGTATGNGAGITNLNGSNIASGQVSSTVLPSTISYTTKDETISGVKTDTSSRTVTAAGGLAVTYETKTGSLTVTGGGDWPTFTPTADNLDYRMAGSSGSVTVGHLAIYSSTSGALIDGGVVPSGGGSGSSTLAIATGTLNGFALPTSSPTAAINFSSDAFKVSLTGSATAFVTPNFSSITAMGGTFNGANQLVKLDGSGNLPALNGSALTNLNGSNITSGMVDSSVLPSTISYTTKKETFTGGKTHASSMTVNSSVYISTSVDASGQGIVFDSPLKSVYSITQTSNAVISAGFFSCTNNDTTALFTGQSGHIPCVFGLFQDLATSNNIGYGLEGRTNALGQASEYAGALALGTHKGAYTGTLSGLIVRTEMYASDGSTPLSTGTMRQLWIKDPVGSGLDAGRTHSLFNESTKPSYSSASFIIGGDTVPISDNALYVNSRNQTGTFPAVVFRSGVSSRYFWQGLGRTGTEASIVVPASNNAFMTGTNAGDFGLRADGATNKVVIGAGSGQATLYVNQGSATVNGAMTVTASSLAVNGVYMVWPSSGTIGAFLRYVSSNTLAWDMAPAGAGGTPSGTSNNVQYNSNGSFAGASGFNIWPSSIAVSDTYATYTSTLNVSSSFTVTGLSELVLNKTAITFSTMTHDSSVPNEGETYNGATQQALVTKISGATQTINGTIFTLTDSSANFNTANAVDMLGTGINGNGVSTTGLTLPANFWTPGKTVYIVMTGTFTTTSTPAIVSSITLGGTLIVSTNNVQNVATGGQSYWELTLMLTCRSTGASGKIWGSGKMRLNNTRTAVTNMTLLDQGNTVNTTAAQQLRILMKWGTANTSNNITATNAFIEVKN